MSETEFNCWKYDRGQWIKTKAPFDWPIGEDWTDVLERNGYHDTPQAEFGLDSFGAIQIYTRRDAGSEYPIIMDVCPLGSRAETVIVDDFPSLMMFMEHYGLIVCLAHMEMEFSELMDILRRGFHALHGHYPDDVCRECDPLEKDARTARKRKLAKGMTVPRGTS